MTTTTKFHGYQTKINGKVAYVVNETETHRKVVFGVFCGYAGWSGGAKAQYSFSGPRVWVAK